MPWFRRAFWLVGFLLGLPLTLGVFAGGNRSSLCQAIDPPPIPERLIAVYDPDPNHLWNRLYQALLALSDGEGMDDPDQLDPFIGHRNPNRSRGEKVKSERTKRVADILNEFLAKEGGKLVRDPRKRALLQRDLWAWFDGLELPRSVALTSNQAGLIGLASRVAKVLPQLALSTEEIEGLPSNVAEAFAAGSFPAWMEADRLWEGDGPWVVLGAEDQSPLARTHFSFFGGRSVFLVLLRYPQGRETTLKNISPLRPGGASPKMPEGAYFALARRMRLIDRRGLIATTPVIESLEVRGLGQHVFKLNRKAFLAGKPSLLPLKPGDTERSRLVLLGRNAGDGQARVVSSCGSCHTPDTMECYARFFSFPPSLRPGVIASDPAKEIGHQRHLKFASHEWGLLQGLGHSGP